MAFNPLFIITDFFCIFQTNFAMTTLGLKETGKFLWEGREKSLPSWLSQFSFAKLRQPTGQTFFPTFLKEFFHFLQTLGSHSKVCLENAKKVWYYEKWVGRHASFPPRRSVN